MLMESISKKRKLALEGAKVLEQENRRKKNYKEELNVQFVLLRKKQKNSGIMLPYHNLGGNL
uniref:Putative rve-domain-containing protein n=1 Tax=Moniliophthora roreri TaxID=221103 RepID=A0A0W0FYU9_MONRR